jgi:hypothetical protein
LGEPPLLSARGLGIGQEKKETITKTRITVPLWLPRQASGLSTRSLASSTGFLSLRNQVPAAVKAWLAGISDKLTASILRVEDIQRKQ